jgi:hypothetical protein
MATAKTIKSRYESLKVRREPFLLRAREYAALTIPSLLPPLGFNYTARLPEPYQGFGSRAVSNLSSRLLTALLPPGQTFFRFRVPNATLMKSGSMTPPKEVEQGFSLSEGLVMSEVERRGWRQPTTLSLQLLITTGNALEHMLPDNRLRVFRLDQYVVCRDSTGNVLEIIIEEKLAPEALPEAAQHLVPSRKESDAYADIELYTMYKLRPDGTYMSRQEVAGKMVPNSQGRYKTLPVQALRWAVVPGEDYGRGKVEEHIGDVRSLENYSKAMQDGAAMASRHITLVRPNAAGGNLRQRIAKANNGDVLAGNPDDVAMLQFTNVQGLQITQSEIQRLVPQLAAAFLMVGEQRRDAERVTATELRMLAEELEGALGGVYSLLSEEMQKWRLQRLIVQMQSNGQLPKWKGDMVDTQITTGLEALGREQDVLRVQQAGNVVAAFGPQGAQAAQEYIKFPTLLSKAFSGLGLADSVKTEDEVNADRQRNAALLAAQQGAGQAIGAAGEAAVQQSQGQPA